MIDVHHIEQISQDCSLTEFVGTTVLDTIGLVMADLAVKSSPVEVIKYMTPDQGTSHSNEVIVAVTGDADAVKNAVLTARDVGLQLLVSMGSYPESPATPYLQQDITLQKHHIISHAIPRTVFPLFL